MATIKDIADLAGISRGTVDRVLNNRGAVNAETAKRVKEIAKAVDYHPNKAGIALAAQKKKYKIGVVLFSKDNLFFDEVMRGVAAMSDELQAYGCTILTKQVSFRADKQLQAIDELLDLGIHALVLSPYNDSTISDKINLLSEKGIAVVTTNTDIQHTKRLAYVGSNYYQSGKTAGGLMNLLTSSQVKTGIIMGSPNILCHTERIAGFRTTITDYYPRIQIEEIAENQDDDIISYEATLSLLKNHPGINALYFVSAGVYGGCRAVLSLGLEHQLKIITHDETATTKELMKHNIISATICQQPFMQGEKPIKILFDYLTMGILPEQEYFFTSIDIKIKENLDE